LKVLFVASANRNGITSIVKSQGESLIRKNIILDFYGIKGKGIRGYLSNVPLLKKHIIAFNPDIIHAHYSLSGIAAGLTGVNKPIVVSFMGSDTRSGYLQKKILHLFIRKNKWQKVIVKSRAMRNEIEYNEARVIPNGVNLSCFKPVDGQKLKKKFNFSEEKRTILFLANPERLEKNFHLAEEAYKLVNNDTIELQVKYNLPSELIPEILNAADLILLTSKWEGSPNVVKEAMACNCPVVTTNVGDVEWLFGNEPGYYISSFDPKDVAEKINMAIKFSKEYRKTRGRERLLALELNSEAIAKRIIEIYHEILL